MAIPSLTFAPSQAELSERHESTHVVFVEDACESSEESDSDNEALADDFLASVVSSCSPRFVALSADGNVAPSRLRRGLNVVVDSAARGPPLAA